MTISGCLILVFALSKVGLGLVYSVIAISLGMIISVLAFAFKSVRCTGLLFLLCCGMKEGRKVLIAIGTSIVVFNNVKNILKNLKVLADSIVCNLEAKGALINAISSEFYKSGLYFIYQNAKGYFFNPLNNIVRLTDNFQCNVQISDDKLKNVLNETKQQIEELSSSLSTQLDIIAIVGRIAFLLIGISVILIGAVLFCKQFLSKDNVNYNNVYITTRFKAYDESRRRQHALCVLPLNKTEQDVYITIPSLKMSRKQKQKMHLQIDILTPRRNDDIYRNQLNINLFEPQCTPVPELSLSATWIPLAILISVLLFLGLISAFLIQIKLLVITAFYPDKDLERATYLHNKIQEERALLSPPSYTGEVRKIISQVDFWFPIITRKHLIRKR
ncbi:hypothetical protein GDO78_012522 [Eleutherodactylus coqui]|uniref:Dendritic cell-specific transmembrane protein-like domain-containing protein n=1 Tax=Eleutherodactylus coqui TaxID=57060 RepID=A0A8J6F172_ELECQ|nr:hypothetical protein GDO78_012522 [Eleutherodactylus coqui]